MKVKLRENEALFAVVMYGHLFFNRVVAKGSMMAIMLRLDSLKLSRAQRGLCLFCVVFPAP